MNYRRQQIPEQSLLLKDIDFSQIETGSLDEIITIASSVNLSGHSSSDFHKAYFSTAETKELLLKSGVIATPLYIAEFMVAETLETTSNNISKLSWYDPCCGSGIFIEAILCRYLANTERLAEANLPRITASEISPIGIFYTVLVIKTILAQYNLSFSKYISSGRLCLILDDSLSLFQEENSLLEKTRDKFDVVIGNPPYVRSTRLSAPYKQALKQQFPFTYSGNADLYFYFISSAISSLKSGGIMNFISPANFFRSKSAIQLRELLNETAKLVKLIDLDELSVFEKADIHTAIYWLQRSHIEKEDTYYSYSHLTSNSDLMKLKEVTVTFERKLMSGILSQGWKFISKTSDDDLASYKDVVSIKNSGLKIYSGIRPGLKKAFIFDKDTVLSFNSDIREKWFRPCFDAKHISKWCTDTSDYFILLIPNETVSIPKEIENLLYPYKEDLQNRHDAKNNSRWFALRPCAYYDVFDRTRIVFPDISSKSKFSLNKTKHINLDGSFSIDTDNKALLGILNSNRAWNFFINNCSSIGNAKNNGRLRLKKNHIENLPVPKSIFTNSKATNELSLIVDEIIKQGENNQLINKMNHLVDTLYLTHQ